MIFTSQIFRASLALMFIYLFAKRNLNQTERHKSKSFECSTKLIKTGWLMCRVEYSRTQRKDNKINQTPLGKSLYGDHLLVINKLQISLLEKNARIRIPVFLEVCFLSFFFFFFTFLESDLPYQANKLLEIVFVMFWR